MNLAGVIFLILMLQGLLLGLLLATIIWFLIRKKVAVRYLLLKCMLVCGFIGGLFWPIIGYVTSGGFNFAGS